MVFYILQHLKYQVPPRQNPGAATDIYIYIYKFKIVLVKNEVDQIEFFKIRYSMCVSLGPGLLV